MFACLCPFLLSLALQFLFIIIHRFCFDCRGMEDDHLIQTFYITKPPANHLMTTDPEDSLAYRGTPKDWSIGNTEETIESTPVLAHGKTKKMDPYFQRSYRMISKQINCSAAVSISRTGNKGTHQKRKNGQSGNIEFMEQFEDFFRTFVPAKTKEETQLRRRKSSSKIHSRSRLNDPTSIRSSSSSSSDSNQEQQLPTGKQFPRRKKKPQLTFYDKLKSKLQQKVQHLIDKAPKNRIQKVQTKPKSKKTVEKIIKDKENLKNVQSHLRLSRAGLVIHLDSMETKPNDSTLRKIETQKPKKDKIFQRCLVKNCEIVLENLQNYENEHLNPNSRPPTPLHKRYTSSILQKTCSSEQKTFSQPLGVDLEVLRWRQKCLNIELNCKRSYKNDRPLKEGMRVFGKYCGKLKRKYQSQENTIKSILSQNIEKEDDAIRVYDSMGNVDHLSNYLKSLQ